MPYIPKLTGSKVFLAPLDPADAPRFAGLGSPGPGTFRA